MDINIRFKKSQLQMRQSYDLDLKVGFSINRIKSFYKQMNGNVYVSFSGGKDSTVLLDLVRSIYPSVPAVFVDTGLEYPAVRDFVRSTSNVIWLRPKKDFQTVIRDYGYPVISKEVSQKIYEIRNSNSSVLRDKRLNGDVNFNGKLPVKYRFLLDAPFKISSQCCYVMKKSPIGIFERKTGLSPFLGIMASDSSLREVSYFKTGCNSFSDKRSVSRPLSFWLESDIWDYIFTSKISYSSIYDLGFSRTGCMFCMYGLSLDEISRFDLMRSCYPKIYDFCMNELGLREVLDFVQSK